MRALFFFNSLVLLSLLSCNGRKEGSSSIQKIISASLPSLTQGAATAQPSGYIAYIENKEHGLRIFRELESYRFTLQYKPLEYVVLSDLKLRSGDRKLFEEKKKEFEGLQYFTFRIESLNNENLLGRQSDKEGKRMDYFAFQMQQDFHLVDGGDTLSCVLHHFERTYRLTPFCEFLIAFELPMEKNKESGDKILIFEDRIFNVGTVKLKIRKEDLNSIPTLILNKNETES